MTELKEICKKLTSLSGSDIEILEQVSLQLPFISELTGNDIFIDAMTKNNTDAVVLAWAKPSGNSLYSTSVVGELAYRNNEPAVYHTMTTGEISRDVRGVSQEWVPMAQTVIPIRNHEQKVIGVLIMERNISKELQQEEKVELLSYTAEKLSSTLMFLSMTEKNFEDWVGNGIFIINKQGKITYANKIAAKIFNELVGKKAFGTDFFILMPDCYSVPDVLECLKNPLDIHKGEHFYRFLSYPLITHGEVSGCAISVQDLTDLKKKERELNIQSIIIKEIHHRVKNNLQNIAAVLRLQMRRSESDAVKTEFEASINRIMSIALVHEVFAAKNWDTMNLYELCKRLLNLLIDNSEVDPQKIQAGVKGPAIPLSSRQAIPLTLIINELITNSIKHGIDQDKGGQIIISFNEKNGMINLTVSDSSEKAGKRSLSMSPKGLGMKIVESLVNEELEGFFRFQRKNGVTRAMVCFPKHYREECE